MRESGVEDLYFCQVVKNLFKVFQLSGDSNYAAMKNGIVAFVGVL
jgi:hypothetical protein